ncbi:DNA methyltransferase [Peptostreptococcus anaerobius]|uniref:DNA methyltransferase n=1 Tax=Peptostreptococcus anaerobius TaxID=1261 RepID=UPI0018981962|nr:DNA methyltransferase [Peptostreptococcus anaerobius]MDB8851970.1 N-6 DNA methylase [Peptostreptococcus anaerobius]
MIEAEQREAARQFTNKWRKNEMGNEDQHGRSYWIELLANIFSMENTTDRLDFEKRVIVNGHKKKIDVYIPETHVLIEQKSSDKRLDQKIRNSGDIELTPFEQAKRYNDNLPFDEKARWIITSNFKEIWIYDMNNAVPESDIRKICIDELPDKYILLEFLIKKDVKKLSHEVKISIKAGEIVGLLYDALLKQYKNPDSENTLKQLNILCVRLVFCLYAEDAGIFGRRNMFHDYLEAYPTSQMNEALRRLFEVLNQKPEDRYEYLSPELAEFPYVNGGLFENSSLAIPWFTEEIRTLLLENASEDFDWSHISPTIFGAVFESTLNPETRRSGGMHYTSIENIHKVIDPLFLNNLRKEFNEINSIPILKTRTAKFKKLQDKLASLKWLDPAAGSGNFLTETYISIRRLENEIISAMISYRKSGETITPIMLETINPIKVSINQFYGIEINDFAVTVAKTALWIAESQMLKETEEIVLFGLDFLPLKTNANIHEANALRTDWMDIISPQDLDYIIGNPPFVGAYNLNDAQKKDRLDIMGKNSGILDYVTCWYKKSLDFIGANTRCAFVSTNSITQGQQVAPLWEPLFDQGAYINFAYTSFEWKSEAQKAASVACVIIGFSKIDDGYSRLYIEGKYYDGRYIDGYLNIGERIQIKKSSKPLCDVPEMAMGFKFADHGNLLINDKETYLDIINREPLAQKWIRPFSMGEEFIKGQDRYCLWLDGISPNELKKLPIIKKRVDDNYEWRSAQTKTGDAYKLRETPHLPRPANKFKKGTYIGIPVMSSGERRYIPFGFVDNGMIPGNQLYFISTDSLFIFGVMMSNVHMAWTRATCGRMGKTGYRYGNTTVYNTFPWCEFSEKNISEITKTAQGILEARNQYPDEPLSNLYDTTLMPIELRKAHIANDRAVMKAYGFETNISEEECLARLKQMYQRLVDSK